MKVFLSWSGERSRLVAKALHDLLPEILQDVEPWMSEHEIAAGQRWGDQLNSVLEGAAVGIVCLTKENLNAPWLLYEAGSLAKSVSGSRVVPYLLGLAATDISFPLAQFQGVDTSETGTRKLLDSLNTARPSPMLDDRLDRMFARWWPDLSSRLSQIPDVAPTTQPVRSDRALLEEVLQLARQFATRDSTAASRQLSYVDWAKSVHSVPKAAVDAMDFEELEAYIQALDARDAMTTNPGEESALQSRQAYAKEVLAQRRHSGA
jgi:tetrahydromethanopterin S-methyltransferase subunit G